MSLGLLFVKFQLKMHTKLFQKRELLVSLEILSIFTINLRSTKITLLDYGLPSTIELRFIPRGPKVIEQPIDLEFGKVDTTVLGSSFHTMKNEIVVTLKCLADGYPIPQYEYFLKKLSLKYYTLSNYNSF